MAIDGGLRKRLAPGTKLTAKYKGEQHTAEVVEGEKGKIRFRLADGREFSSPSAAGSALMGGIACNGWRFWSLEDEAREVAADAVAADHGKPAPKARTVASKPRMTAKAAPAKSARASARPTRATKAAAAGTRPKAARKPAPPTASAPADSQEPQREAFTD